MTKFWPYCDLTHLDKSVHAGDDDEYGDSEEKHGAIPLVMDEALGENTGDRGEESSQA